MKYNKDERVLYWKKRIHEKLMTQKRQFEFEFNDVAALASSVDLEPMGIIAAMNTVLKAIDKLSHEVAKAKERH